MTTLTTIGFWPWPVKSVGPGQPPGGGTADPPFSTVSLLLGFDGSFADESAHGHVPSVTDASISTTDLRYGSGGGSFPNDGSLVSFPDHAAFRFDGDFTVECWVYPVTLGKARRLFQQAAGDGVNNAWFAQVSYNAVTSLTLYSDGSTFSTLVSSQTVTVGQWNHLAWSREGSAVRAFVNGQLDPNGMTFAGPLTDAAAPVYVGGNTAAQGNGLNGFLDEVRLTKGVAIYTQSFAPPAGKFPRS